VQLSTRVSPPRGLPNEADCSVVEAARAAFAATVARMFKPGATPDLELVLSVKSADFVSSNSELLLVVHIRVISPEGHPIDEHDLYGSDRGLSRLQEGRSRVGGRRAVAQRQADHLRSRLRIRSGDSKKEGQKWDDPVAGTARISARNDGGFLSKPVAARVFDDLLAITGIDPKKVAAGVPAFKLTVTGSGFLPASQVLWNDSALDTTFISGALLNAEVPASLVSSAGEGVIQVSTPGCDLGPTGFCFMSKLPPILEVGQSTKTTVPVAATNIVWDAMHARLYLSLLIVSRVRPPSSPSTPAASAEQRGQRHDPYSLSPSLTGRNHTKARSKGRAFGDC
jgi:hypothetical protein